MRIGLIFSLTAWLYAGGVLAGAPAGVRDGEALPLTAKPVPLNAEDPAQDRIGRLRYLGGVALTSANPAFGGLSGLRIGPGGQALSVGDTGNWVAFRLVERRGRLIDVTGGWIAPLRDDKGRPPYNKDFGDAEALEWDPASGAATVIFEQDHRAQHYAGIDPARPATLDAPARVVREPAMRGWPSNGGGEAYALLGGQPVTISEAVTGPAGGREVVERRGAMVVRSSFPTPDDYDPTDMAADGDALIVVSRMFGPSKGVAARIVRWRPGEPETELARLAPPLTVDNIEGLAVTRSGGRTFVYLLSDDNFNPLQRTLLLKFEVLG